MGKFSADNLPEWMLRQGEELRQLKISLHAANATFFLVLAFFPGLFLLLELLHDTSLDPALLCSLLAGLLPQSILKGVEELILLTYSHTSGLTLGLSAFTALWSASRGIRGLITGLNAMYAVEERRGYFRVRAISVAYTFVFLLVILATLVLQVFGTDLLELLRRTGHPLVQFLVELIDIRFLLLLALQSGLFTAMFMALPCGGNRFRDSVPGALLACLGWMGFSWLYAVYMEHFAGLSGIYGSVYAVAVSMLWLYWCMKILFFGGAVNRLLMQRKNMEKM